MHEASVTHYWLARQARLRISPQREMFENVSQSRYIQSGTCEPIPMAFPHRRDLGRHAAEVPLHQEQPN